MKRIAIFAATSTLLGCSSPEQSKVYKDAKEFIEFKYNNEGSFYETSNSESDVKDAYKKHIGVNGIYKERVFLNNCKFVVNRVFESKYKNFEENDFVSENIVVPLGLLDLDSFTLTELHPGRPSYGLASEIWGNAPGVPDCNSNYSQHLPCQGATLDISTRNDIDVIEEHLWNKEYTSKYANPAKHINDLGGYLIKSHQVRIVSNDYELADRLSKAITELAKICGSSPQKF